VTLLRVHTMPDSQLLSWFAAHWETLLLVALLGGAGLWVFRSTLAVYGRIFFPARAVRNAFIKTVLMVALLYAIYALPYWLFQTLLPPGWLRSLSFLLSFVLFDVLWAGTGRLLDRLLVGR
jgi:hypothetical protein